MQVVRRAGDNGRDFVTITHDEAEIQVYVHYPTDGREPYLVVEVEDPDVPYVDEQGHDEIPSHELDKPVRGLKVLTERKEG